MSSILVALSALIAPGFAHGLLSQRRAMAIVIGLIVLCIAGALLMPWSAYLAVLVLPGSAIDAGLRHRRLRPSRLDWKLALSVGGSMIVLRFVVPELIVEAFKIPASSMHPTLQIGDHIFVNKLAAQLRGPERGEIIVFAQPCFPSRDYIKRVIALEGETVEIRCNVVYVDGAAVPSTLVRADDHYLDHYDVGGQWEKQPVSRYRETLGDHSFEVFHDAERPQRDEVQRSGTVKLAPDARDFPGPGVGLGPPSCNGAHEMGSNPAVNQVPGTIIRTAEGLDACKPHLHYEVPRGHVFVLGDNRPNSNDSRVWGAVPIENIKGPVTSIWYPFGRIGRVE